MPHHARSSGCRLGVRRTTRNSLAVLVDPSGYLDLGGNGFADLSSAAITLEHLSLAAWSALRIWQSVGERHRFAARLTRGPLTFWKIQAKYLHLVEFLRCFAEA
jgi:hypothetical protein